MIISMHTNEYCVKTAVWLLLLYTYAIWLRTIILPNENIISPALLMIVLTLLFFASRGKLWIGSSMQQSQAILWILILFFISFNNSDFFWNFFNRGMIQYYIMVFFMLSVYKTNKWISTWIYWNKIYVIIHSIATIFFYIFKGFYPIFASMAFFGEELFKVLKQFNSGWMPGICKNVSANGMVLSVTFLVYVGSFFRSSEKKIWNKIRTVLIIFALLLTGKRGPLLAIVISMAIVYLAQQKQKSVIVKFLKLAVIGSILIVVFVILSQHIPALSNLIGKSEELSSSSKGILNGRQTLWNIAFDMIKSSPIIGKGYGSYANYAVMYGGSTSSTHNLYLQVFAELGIVGLIAYLCAFAVGVVSTVKEIRRTNETRKQNVLNISLLVQVFTICYSFSSTSLMYYYILIPYFFACGASRTITYERICHENNRRYNVTGGRVYEDRNNNFH